jgi:hypothetical protein
MRTTVILALAAMLPQLAQAQTPPRRGTELPAFEAEGPHARQEGCQRVAAALMRTELGEEDRIQTLWSVSRCEVSGVPALLHLWRSPDLGGDEQRVLLEVTYTIQDLRILRLAESIALDPAQPDLRRFAALSVVSEYLRPGSGHIRPERWFSDNAPPGTVMVNRRINPTWVRGPVPVTENDLRSLRPTLEDLAAREEDPVRPIAEHLLFLMRTQGR